MGIPTIVTNYDNIFTGTWKVGGVATAISSGATIKAMIVSNDHGTALTSAVTQPSDNTGADWDNGVIGFKFAATDLANITTYKPCMVEVQVDDGVKTPAFFYISLVKGNITG